MDPNALVEGGVHGLQRIVEVLEKNGVPIVGAYLIKLTSDDGFEDIVFRVVTTMQSHSFIFLVVKLRREGGLPHIDSRVRFDVERKSSDEASRILKYAAEVGTPVVTIRGAGLDGLYVEDAVVVKWPKQEKALA